MNIHIHSLEKTLYGGTARVVTLPGLEGEISILPNHIPLVTILKSGIVRVRTNEVESKEFPIEGGFAQISKGGVIILLTNNSGSVPEKATA